MRIARISKGGLGIRKQLAKMDSGYPTDVQEQAVRLVIEQAELFARAA